MYGHKTTYITMDLLFSHAGNQRRLEFYKSYYISSEEFGLVDEVSHKVEGNRGKDVDKFS